MKEVYFDPLVIQVLSLCHYIDAIVVDSEICSSPLHLFQSLDSSRRLLLLSALHLRDEEFVTFMIIFNNHARLQVLELSVSYVNGHTLPSLPEHNTFPSLHTLILWHLDPLIVNAVSTWELPSLKALSISHWDPPISTALLSLIQRSYEKLEIFSTCLDLLHDPALHDIIRVPPFYLRNVTLKIATSKKTRHRLFIQPSGHFLVM